MWLFPSTGCASSANTTTPSLNALLAARYPTELVRDNCPLAGFTVDDGLPKTLASAGVATLEDGAIKRRRAAGKLANLERVLAEEPLAGVSGIGRGDRVLKV